MDDYLCLYLVSKAEENAAEFKARLSGFWTHMLRSHPAVFGMVYAESTEFESKGARLVRKYLIQAGAVPDLEAPLRSLEMDFEPIDESDVYSRYEAAPPEWFWIEH